VHRWSEGATCHPSKCSCVPNTYIKTSIRYMTHARVSSTRQSLSLQQWQPQCQGMWPHAHYTKSSMPQYDRNTLRAFFTSCTALFTCSEESAFRRVSVMMSRYASGKWPKNREDTTEAMFAMMVCPQSHQLHLSLSRSVSIPCIEEQGSLCVQGQACAAIFAKQWGEALWHSECMLKGGQWALSV
jgi:hypothetical protein